MMITAQIVKKMEDLAEGKFTYASAREIPPALIAEIYNSSPIYFGLVGKVIQTAQNDLDLLNLPSQKAPDPEKKIYILIQQNDKPVALLNCILDYPEEGIVLLGWMMVNGNFVFQGIGRTNYQIFCNAMKELGMRQIRILIETQNKEAQTFWKSVGFRPIPGFAKQGKMYEHMAIEHYLDIDQGGSCIKPD
ncbi:MAG: hypothetical protein VB108_08115 [Anaerolineaceae bacterium]|nr:hypothetical protein [Anaerolineaceae bacterium]